MRINRRTAHDGLNTDFNISIGEHDHQRPLQVRPSHRERIPGRKVPCIWVWVLNLEMEACLAICHAAPAPRFVSTARLNRNRIGTKIVAPFGVDLHESTYSPQSLRRRTHRAG